MLYHWLTTIHISSALLLQDDVPDDLLKDEVEDGSDKEPDDGKPKSPEHKAVKAVKSSDVLPAMRKERAASIAKRKQRPISTVAHGEWIKTYFKMYFTIYIPLAGSIIFPYKYINAWSNLWLKKYFETPSS